MLWLRPSPRGVACLTRLRWCPFRAHSAPSACVLSPGPLSPVFRLARLFCPGAVFVAASSTFLAAAFMRGHPSPLCACLGVVSLTPPSFACAELVLDGIYPSCRGLLAIGRVVHGALLIFGLRLVRTLCPVFVSVHLCVYRPGRLRAPAPLFYVAFSRGLLLGFPSVGFWARTMRGPPSALPAPPRP